MLPRDVLKRSALLHGIYKGSPSNCEIKINAFVYQARIVMANCHVMIYLGARKEISLLSEEGRVARIEITYHSVSRNKARRILVPEQ